MEQAYVSQGTSIDKGENARLSSFVGAIAISDLMRTTLGPCGLDKILQRLGPSPHDQGISVTNDGATILSSIPIDNPAAKVLVDIAKVQDSQVGDGTTSVAVLAGELLRQAEALLLNERLHPSTVAQGWQLAKEAALHALVEQATVANSDNDKSNSSIPSRAQLMEIAQTTLSSKLLVHEKEHFATLAVDAVLRVYTNNHSNTDGTTASSAATDSNKNTKNSGNLSHIQVLKMTGGSLRDSYLDEGFLLGKLPGTGQPQSIVGGARILLANTSMDTDKIKMYGSRIKVDSLDQVATLELAEKEKMKQKVEKILNHSVATTTTTTAAADGDTKESMKMNCFINRQLIYNYPESIFAQHGVMAIEHADFDGMERLAAVLGGTVASTFDAPHLTVLGQCDAIEQILIGEDKVMRFSGCKGGSACSIVLRGASSHVLDEAERSLHDALAILASVVRDDSGGKFRTIYGGGCSEIAMASAVDAAAQRTPGKRALAMTAFAQALRQLPRILADNGGYDAAELVAQLQAAHAAGKADTGLDLNRGSIASMHAMGIRESYQSKKQMLLSAAEAAEMILRVDDIIKAAPRRREEMGY